MYSTTTLLAGLSAIALVSAAPAKLAKRASGVYIQQTGSPTGTPEFCLGTVGPAADGVIVNFMTCSSTQTSDPTAANYALWDISAGNQQSLKLTGTNFCLDAGTNPGPNMVEAKIWTCYPGLAQQQFYYTDDLHIAVTNYSSCLSNGRYGAQFQQCGAAGVGTQTFAAISPGSGSTSTVSSSATPTTTTSTSTTSSNPFPTTGMGVRFIHPTGDKTKCLTITGNQIYDGAAVGYAACRGASDPNVGYQLWSFDAPGVTSITSSYHNVCLDFGTGGGSNGTPMKVWTCYPGLFQQTLYYTDDLHIAVYGGNQCLDVKAGTTDVQSWQCSGTDNNQIFSVSI